MTLKKKALENTVVRGENAGNQHFLPLPVFPSLSKRNIVISATFNLSSGNTFNLVMSKNLSFGKGWMFKYDLSKIEQKVPKD